MLWDSKVPTPAVKFCGPSVNRNGLEVPSWLLFCGSVVLQKLDFWDIKYTLLYVFLYEFLQMHLIKNTRWHTIVSHPIKSRVPTTVIDHQVQGWWNVEKPLENLIFKMCVYTFTMCCIVSVYKITLLDAKLFSSIFENAFVNGSESPVYVQNVLRK